MPLRFQLRCSAGVYLVVLLLAAAGCGNRRSIRNEHKTSGDFDYYVLALSWAPAFCAHEAGRRTARECTAGREIGFVVHGLWPQREGGRALEFCAPVPPLAPEITSQMSAIMPDPVLIQHEWHAHGSCSGLTAEEYFANVRRASENIRVPELYRSLHRALTTNPVEVERRFAIANRVRGTSAIRVQCREGELREIRICLTKDLHPRSCSWSVRDCRAGQLFMRPIQ